MEGGEISTALHFVLLVVTQGSPQVFPRQPRVEEVKFALAERVQQRLRAELLELSILLAALASPITTHILLLVPQAGTNLVATGVCTRVMGEDCLIRLVEQVGHKEEIPRQLDGMEVVVAADSMGVEVAHLERRDEAVLEAPLVGEAQASLLHRYS